MFSYYFFELRTLDQLSFGRHYYFVSCKAIRNLNTTNFPQKIRLLIEDREETPVSIRPLNPFSYIWKKYFQKWNYKGVRVNWEKEKI